MSEFKFPCNVAVVKELNESPAILVTLLEDGSVYGEDKIGWGDPCGTKVKLNISNVKDIVQSKLYILLLKEDGTVYFLDTYRLKSNDCEYILNKLNIDNVKKIIASQFNEDVTCLKEDGTVYSFIELGIANLRTNMESDENAYTIVKPTKIPLSHVKDIACGSNHTVFLLEYGTVYDCGYYGRRSNKIDEVCVKELSLVKLPGRAKSISCNRDCSVFELENGDKYGYGRPSDLGIETENDFCTKEPILLNQDRIESLYNKYSLLFK